MSKLYRFDATALNQKGLWPKIFQYFGSVQNAYHQLLWQHKTYPNTEFFWSIIFWLNIEQIAIFDPNMGKYLSEINPYSDSFHVVDRGS